MHVKYDLNVACSELVQNKPRNKEMCMREHTYTYSEDTIPKILHSQCLSSISA